MNQKNESTGNQSNSLDLVISTEINQALQKIHFRIVKNYNGYSIYITVIVY